MLEAGGNPCIGCRGSTSCRSVRAGRDPRGWARHHWRTWPTKRPSGGSLRLLHGQAIFPRVDGAAKSLGLQPSPALLRVEPSSPPAQGPNRHRPPPAAARQPDQSKYLTTSRHEGQCETVTEYQLAATDGRAV